MSYPSNLDTLICISDKRFKLIWPQLAQGPLYTLLGSITNSIRLTSKICQIYLLHPIFSSTPNPSTPPSSRKQQPGLFSYIPPIYALHSSLNKAFKPLSHDSIPSRLHSSAYKSWWYTLDFVSAWDPSCPVHTHTSFTLISTLQKDKLPWPLLYINTTLSSEKTHPPSPVQNLLFTSKW